MSRIDRDWLPDWIRIYDNGRMTWYDGCARGAGKRVGTTCRNVAAAEERARELLGMAARAADLAIAPNATWADLAHRWAAEAAPRIKHGTAKQRITALNAWILPRIGGTLLVETSLATLLAVADDVVDAKPVRGLSTLDNVVDTMSVVAEWANERKWLADDAFGTDVKRRRALKARRKQVRDLLAASTHADEPGDMGGDDEADIALDEHITIDMVPTWGDVSALADAVGAVLRQRDHDALTARRGAAAIRLAAGTGLRQCELLGLTVGRARARSGFVVVDRQLDRYRPWLPGERMPTAPPKFGRKRHAHAWDKVKDDLEFLCGARDGLEPLILPPLPVKWWADSWATIVRQASADCGFRWTPHWLRHHYASYCLTPRDSGGLGVAPPDVQASMGHRKLSTLLDIYYHQSRPPSGFLPT